MSLSAKSMNRKATPVLDRCILKESSLEVRRFLNSSLVDEQPYWQLSRSEAEEIIGERGRLSHAELMKTLSARGKSAGARYIAARILAGAKPDIPALVRDWFAHKKIRSALSASEIKEIGTSVAALRRLGVGGRCDVREFYTLYCEVRVPNRTWSSSRQADPVVVAAIAANPKCRALPVWVKRVLTRQAKQQAMHLHLNTERAGDVRRLFLCSKAWKHAPFLPKRVAERIGKMPVRNRILAHWAWAKVAGGNVLRDLRNYKWWLPDDVASRQELIKRFWLELRRLQALSITSLIQERFEIEARFGSQSLIPWDHYSMRILAEDALGLPYKALSESWGRHQDSSIGRYLDAIAAHSLSDECR